MPTTPEQNYLNGYDRMRTVCLTKGVDAAQQCLTRSTQDEAFRGGAKAAIFDYEDANGLPHSTSHRLSI